MITSKEQERKALEQIKKIIAGLGENSYIATAMDGMIEDAETNIENDFAMSWKDRAITYERKLEELAKIHDRDTYETGKKLELTEKELKLAQQTMQQEAERANGAWQRVEELKSSLKEMSDLATERLDELVKRQSEAEQMKMEIIKLKEKLYDLMDK